MPQNYILIANAASARCSTTLSCLCGHDVVLQIEEFLEYIFGRFLIDDSQL